MSAIHYERAISSIDGWALCAALTARGGACTLQVSGSSMLPVLPSGAIVTFGVPRHPLAVGSLVLARNAEQVVLHRVLWRWHGRYLLAGDAAAHCDGWVVAADVAGVVSSVRVNADSLALSRRRCWLLALGRRCWRMMRRRLRSV